MRSPYRVVMQAYPSDYRRQHGGELIDTAHELAGRRWSFRQSRSLLIGGLRTRAWCASRGSFREVWAAGIALALALGFAVRAQVLIALVLGNAGNIIDPDGSPWVDVALAVVPLVVLSTTTRWPAVLAITASAIIELVSHPMLDSGLGGERIILTRLGGMIAMVFLSKWMASHGRGQRALSPMAAIALLVGFAALSYAGDSTPMILMMAIYLGLPVVGLLLVAVDPRPLIVCTTLWLISAAYQIPFFVLFVGFEQTIEAAVVIVLPLLVTIVSALASIWGTRRLTAQVQTQ